jgi:hypothetical protein
MAKHFRTLLLLGLTGAMGTLSGCIVETSGGQGPGPGYGGGGGGGCAASQFIAVQWLMDKGVGTAPLLCAGTSPTSVELTLAGGQLYVVDGTCDDTYRYNWFGQTPHGVVQAGDYVTQFRLLDTGAGTEVSPGGTFTAPSTVNPSVPTCSSVLLTYEFPVN